MFKIEAKTTAGTSSQWLLIAFSALLATFTETCPVGLVFNVGKDALMEIFGLFLPSLSGVFMAFMVVGPQVRPASKSSSFLTAVGLFCPMKPPQSTSGATLLWVRTVMRQTAIQ